MMTHILLNLTEAYENIVENLEDEMDDKYYPPTIKNICDKLSVKYDQTNIRPETKNSKEDKETFN